MSSRMARYADRDSRRAVSPIRRRRFTEVPESRDRRSPRESSRHRESDRGFHSRRRERSRSRSLLRREREEPVPRTERRYRETPPREKRKFREEREDEEPKKKRSPSGSRPSVREAPIDESPPVRRFDQTEFLLNDRFSALSTSRNLIVEENVSVEIERKIPGRESFKIPRVLEPSAVAIPKVALENRGPLTSRDEFRIRGGTFVIDNRPEGRLGTRSLERRVIRPGDARPEPAGMGEMIGRDRKGREDWNGSPLKNNNRYNDLHVGRHRGQEGDESGLPDFSKRPGKYSYDAWKDKPELIPKGKSYFEHDVRNYEDNDNARRARDVRGGQWPRGRVPRGRGYSRPVSGPPTAASRVDTDVWRHDKFEELLAEESQDAT